MYDTTEHVRRVKQTALRLMRKRERAALRRLKTLCTVLALGLTGALAHFIGGPPGAAVQGAYYDAVKWARKKGVTGGIGGELFGPDRPCTRAQIVTFLWRASKASADGAPAFSDVAADAYCTEAVKWATDNGVTSGTTDTTFSPGSGCTRAQIVTFLYRASDQ